jgi:hypothetical protein
MLAVAQWQKRRAVNAVVASSILASQPKNLSGALGKSGLSRHSLNVENVSSNLTRPASLKCGTVTQTARVLDCRSRSYGFESRPFRQNFPRASS